MRRMRTSLYSIEEKNAFFSVDLLCEGFAKHPRTILSFSTLIVPNFQVFKDQTFYPKQNSKIIPIP